MQNYVFEYLNENEFKVISFNQELLEGIAETSYIKNATASSELEIIKEACFNKSQQMDDNFKIEYDGRPFSCREEQLDNNTTIRTISFGFEVKTKD